MILAIIANGRFPFRVEWYLHGHMDSMHKLEVSLEWLAIGICVALRMFSLDTVAICAALEKFGQT